MVNIKDKEKLKEALIQQIKDILDNLGDGDISPSAYDTAWVARIPSKEDPTKPMFPQCLKWVIDNQLPDGSWGADLKSDYYSDKLICTIAALNCLKIWERLGYSSYTSILDNGLKFLNNNIPKVNLDKFKTVGFEVIFPKLIKEGIRLGLSIIYDEELILLNNKRDEKLKLITPEILNNYRTTLLHSLEGIDESIIDWQKISQLKDITGSLLTSPSATAFYYLNTNDPIALKYIQERVGSNSYVTVGYPLDLFTIIWGLEIIEKLDLSIYFQTEIKRKIDYLYNYWDDTRGISWSSSFKLTDLDDTAGAYYLLKRYNKKVNYEVFDNFYDGHKLFCFKGELDSSPTHLFHFLDVYDGPNQILINQALKQLKILFRNGNKYLDKWHLSPYYLISMSIESCEKYEDLKDNKVVDLILNTQNSDKGWGQGLSSVEETCRALFSLYKLQKIDMYKEYLPRIHFSISKGISFLLKNNTKYSPNLWIEKCLFSHLSLTELLLLALLFKNNQVNG